MPALDPAIELELLAIERERRRRAAGGVPRVDEAARQAYRLSEIAKCRASAEYFIDTYGIIDNSQRIGEAEGASVADDGSGTTPFKLWPDQRRVLREVEENKRSIILKARQLGISWTIIGFIWWACKWRPGEVALLFSITEEDATVLVERIKSLEDRLPDWMKAASPIARSNQTKILYANHSKIISRAATPTGGSGLTASILLIDEAAKIEYARQLYAAAKPTVDKGRAKLIVVSTAYGTGNLFHDLWEGAVAGLNRFQAIFLPWMADPGRTQEWYDEQVASATDPDSVRENYPANPTEAFVSSGRVRFHHSWVAIQDGNLRDPISPDSISGMLREIPGLSVYTLPDRTRRVAIGCDVAEGKEDGDYDCATVVDRDTLEELACLHGQFEIDEYADYLDQLSRIYNGWLVVERNNHGHAVLARLRGLDNRAIANGHDGDQGWLTSSKTKPATIATLAELLRDDGMVIRSRATLNEIANYRKLGNGKTGAPSGKHDDRVMSWAVLVGWLRIDEPDLVAFLRPDPTAGIRWGTLGATHGG
jgi:hypothetical protein